MSLRFPLYARILVWFFLNLVLLGFAFYVVFRIQFRPGLDSLLAGRAGDRIQILSDVIAEELAETSHENWNEVLARFSRPSAVQFFLFRPDGMPLAGPPIELPKRIRAELNRGVPLFRPQPPVPPPLPRPPPPRDDRGRPPALEPAFREPALARPPEDPGTPRPAAFRFMRRTDNPTRYWVGVRLTVPLKGRPRSFREPVTLLAMSESWRGGGLFFDPVPWMAAGFAAVLFSVLFWIPLVRGITRAISQMTRATEQIGEGHFETRVASRRGDELGRLGAAINHLAGRLSTFVSGQKRFLGDTAHELSSPLARLQLALAILEQRAGDKEKPYVEDVRQEAQQMTSLVNELLSFAKASLGGSTIQLQRVELSPLIEEVARREKNAEVTLNVHSGMAAVAEPELLKRALANLIRNAVSHAAGTGPVAVETVTQDDRVLIRVSDRGSGVPEESLPQLFDPFYRVDNSRARESGGVGLGLTIVKSCVDACQGTVVCRNLQPRGFQVEIGLAVAPG